MSPSASASTHRATLPLLLAACAATAAIGACGDDPVAAPRYDYTTPCQVGQDVRPAPSIQLTPAFARLSFEAPIALAHFNDGSGRIAIAERAGRVRVIDARAEAAPIALDISDKVYSGFECGFIGFAIDPSDPRKSYAHYCTKRDGQTLSVIAEWTDFTSERVLLEVAQPYDNHNGGGLAFGPDGALYIGFGDGGLGDDPLGSGQDKDSLLGKILRIAPATSTATSPYAIPADNPFADGGGRPEIYAWGLRNPWRFSFDRETGELWVGDVGQNATEEINLVTRGKNYGWKIMEGSVCRPGGPDTCNTNDLELPVIEYDHDLGRSVTGGYVYRGAAVPALRGRYIYGDYSSRRVFSWAVGEPAPRDALMVFDGGLGSFGEDEAGEVYALDLEGGTVFRFEEGIGGPAEPPPARLSETGCFVDLATLTPAQGVLGYDVAVPFWSDGASKDRFVVMPEGGRITPPSADDPGGAFGFPIGTVFVKHFELKASEPTRIETRFLIQEALGVRGFTYRWDDDGADATLATDGARFPLGANDWHLPSATDCTTCHRGRGVLGFEARQIGSRAAELHAQGLLTAPPTPRALLPTPAASPGANAPLADRARAWLHVNCSYCHDGLGPSGTALDLRVTAASLAACDELPQRGDLGIADARIVAPGDPARSVLWRRISTRDASSMPPLGTDTIDPDVDVVRMWIESLADPTSGTCP